MIRCCVSSCCWQSVSVILRRLSFRVTSDSFVGGDDSRFDWHGNRWFSILYKMDDRLKRISVQRCVWVMCGARLTSFSLIKKCISSSLHSRNKKENQEHCHKLMSPAVFCMMDGKSLQFFIEDVLIHFFRYTYDIRLKPEPEHTRWINLINNQGIKSDSSGLKNDASALATRGFIRNKPLGV